MKAGKYFVGDPCYCFTNATWQKLLDSSDAESLWDGDAIINLNGQELWAGATAYGDGLYYDEEGFEYPVDSALIGAVPVDLIEVDLKELIGSGRFENFNEDFNPLKDDGAINVGCIKIDTNC